MNESVGPGSHPGIEAQTGAEPDLSHLTQAEVLELAMESTMRLVTTDATPEEAIKLLEVIGETHAVLLQRSPDAVPAHIMSFMSQLTEVDERYDGEVAKMNFRRIVAYLDPALVEARS